MASTIDPRPADPAAFAAATSASLNYHLPGPSVSGAITSYYMLEVKGPGVVRDLVFPEWTNFRLILSGRWDATFADRPDAPEQVPAASIAGTLERAALISGSAGLVVGIGVMPQGWPMLTAAPADGFTNRLRPLSDALGSAADDLHSRLMAANAEGLPTPARDDAFLTILDDVFEARLAETPDAAVVAAAHAALQDPQVETVSHWAAALDLSARQLERFSRRYFGLPPKALLRRQRLLRTLAAMREANGGTWSQQLDAQFTDQAHFIHEFNYYMGTSPTAYLARPQPIMGEAWTRRKALLGAPVGLLQPPTRSL